MKLAGTTAENGTETGGVELVFGYFGLPTKAGVGMVPADLVAAVDKGYPTMITLQAYRDAAIVTPYRELWAEGHCGLRAIGSSPSATTTTIPTTPSSSLKTRPPSSAPGSRKAN